ncbi:DNA repair protein RAD51 homolog 3 isoform X2 [Amborella trichopoda]|uniref:DNA repair protein RAD51 homolog 3 isoform X2 n=1 Tax=Amborella trichopoda TaxID=13333 RepID=UPI0005D31863|nr:DNA repair protein RAD51 homolog 3 isoform X2 [Amborella trichopoda]|eukprot:XP_011628330.1 DNA repair protein RAD51 homolog 3 isoform X2 [Amborella trichopoda]
MEIWSLPFSPSQRAKLLSAGYTYLHSFSHLSPSALAADLDVSPQEASDVLRVVTQAGMMRKPDSIVAGAQTAWDILCEDRTMNHITTSCEDLDGILGGGISCKEITEVGGVPGIGKTQLGIQLAVNVQIPVEYGGLGGKAIYVEGSFMVERAFQIAESCIQDIMDKVLQTDDVGVCQENLHVNAILANIFYFRICSYTEQIAVVNYLEKFISAQKDVKIIIIDSVTFHFRQDFDDLALRTRVLSALAQKMMKLAKKFNLAVVLLNQVTTKCTDGSFQLTLALGESWSHACTNRIILYWKGNERCAYLDKSPSLPLSAAPFSVTTKGIRSVASSCKRMRTT